MADTLRCSLQAISDWVAEGIFPPPWLEPGKGRRVSLWRTDHLIAYDRDNAWPKEAWRDGAGGQS